MEKPWSRISQAWAPLKQKNNKLFAFFSHAVNVYYLRTAAIARVLSHISRT